MCNEFDLQILIKLFLLRSYNISTHFTNYTTPDCHRLNLTRISTCHDQIKSCNKIELTIESNLYNNLFDIKRIFIVACLKLATCP